MNVIGILFEGGGQQRAVRCECENVGKQPRFFDQAAIGARLFVGESFEKKSGALLVRQAANEGFDQSSFGFQVPSFWVQCQGLGYQGLRSQGLSTKTRSPSPSFKNPELNSWVHLDDSRLGP